MRYTSVSAVTTFDPTVYAGCPRRWWFTKIGGRKEPETKSQAIGSEGHGQIEHFLRTGEDVLGPIARAVKVFLPKPGPDLIVENGFGDMGRAIKLRDGYLCGTAALDELKRSAGLEAAGVPFVGYIDLLHTRGEYVDVDGSVRLERLEAGRVAEVHDHKFTSSIENYAKTPSELVDSPQMVGYGLYAHRAYGIDHARLSHGYAQTRGSKIGKKVTALVPVGDLLRKWERVESVVRAMEDVAREPDVAKIDANLKSCTAYREGCPHRTYCPKSPVQMVVSLLGKSGGTAMSLLQKNAQTAAATPATNGAAKPASTSSIFNQLKKDAVPSPEHTAQVAVEKAKLAEEDVKPASSTATAAPRPGAKVPVTKCEAGKKYFVDLEEGRGLRVMEFTGTSKNFYIFLAADGDRGKLEAADDVHLVEAAASVVPSDAPAPGPLERAAPVPAETAAAIEDPALKKKVEEHNAAHAAAAAVETAKTAKVAGGSRCPGGNQKIALTAEQLAERKAVCPAGCGEVRAVKPMKEGEVYVANFPGHMVKVELEPGAIAGQEVLPNVPMPAARSAQAQEDDGLTLYIDVAFERGVAPRDLSDYYTPLVEELAKVAAAPDIRWTMDGPLSHGKWKGALAATVRASLPDPGEWVVHGHRENEIAQVVVEALRPLCAKIVRGVR